jgi:hypothetical protein
MYVIGQIGVDDTGQFIGPINKLAQQWADEHSGDLISGLDEVTRDSIREVIANGLREQLSVDDISELIQSSYAFSDDRADLIATTEAQMANGAGSVEGLRQAEKNGLNVKKEWICDPDPCPECEENQDAGPIDVSDLFPSGDDAEPAHPNCMCFTQGVVEEDDEDEE